MIRTCARFKPRSLSFTRPKSYLSLTPKPTTNVTLNTTWPSWQRSFSSSCHVSNPKKTIITERTASKTLNASNSKVPAKEAPESEPETITAAPNNDGSGSSAKTPSETNAESPKNSDTDSILEQTPQAIPRLHTDHHEGTPVETTDGESSTENTDAFLTTIFENLEPYMDTYEVYTKLIKAGFTETQADEVINLLAMELNTKLGKLSIKYSQLYELENERYLYESAQQELRVDITRSRELHINELINQINVLERDFNTTSDELNNLLIQMKNDTQVSISDQKSENTLLSKKIILRIQETNHKITTELNSAMRSEIESLRWHYSRWGVMAILISLFSVFVSYYIWRARMQKRQNEKNEFVPLIIYEPSEFDEDDYHTDLDKSVIN